MQDLHDSEVFEVSPQEAMLLQYMAFAGNKLSIEAWDRYLKLSMSDVARTAALRMRGNL